MKMERVILHSDLNNFYASVACLYDPALRGKPVARRGGRGGAARHRAGEKRRGEALRRGDGESALAGAAALS